MKTRIVASLTVALAALIGWQTVRRGVYAQPPQVVIPFDSGIVESGATASGGINLFVRQSNNTYTNLQFGISSPHALMSSMSGLTQLVSGGLKSLFATPAGPAGVGLQSQVRALADLDGNGSVGLAFAGGNAVAVYQGTTGFSFHMMTSYNIGIDVNSVFLADFNGDQKPDLAVAYDGGNTPGGIAILLNNGDGTFSSPKTYASGTPATHFAVLDLNHDGHLDISVASLDQMVTVLLGKGDGTFGPPTKYSLGSGPGGSSGPGGGSGQAIAIADVNGDGNPDIVAGGSVGVLLGNGDGTFRNGAPLPAVATGTQIWTFAAGDLNGDGKMDVVYADISNQVVAPLLGNGDGTFRAGQTYAVEQLVDSLILADYNNDGRLDIINGSGDARLFLRPDQSSYIDILLGNGDGTFQGVPAYFGLPNSEANSSFYAINGVALAKFGGGPPGALLLTGGGLTLYPGNGKGGFLAPQAISFSGPERALVSADFNGDGIADAAVASGGNLAIFLGTSTGLAAPTLVPAGSTFASALVAGDFNGDGKVDLVVMGSGTSGTLAFLKGNGDGTFGAPATIAAGVTPTSVAAADINGDGLLDVVFADSGNNGAGGAVYVSLNKGAGVFHAPVSVFAASFPSVAVGDVNGDGKLDLVASSELGNGYSAANWLRGNGDGTFQTPIQIATSQDTDNAILLQDFNNDGHLDLVLAHQDEDTTYLAGNGDGTFSAENHLLTGPESTFLASADLNGDGKPDLVAAGFTMTVLLGQPTPRASTLNSASFTSAVAVGSIATVFGSDLATAVSASSTTVSVTDASDLTQLCTLFYVSPSQVNFLIPASAAVGTATVTVQSGDGTISQGTLALTAVAPGIYAANGILAAALSLTVTPAGTPTTTVLVSPNSAGTLVTAPISLDPSANSVFLILYGTGIRGAPLSQVSAQVAGQTLTPTYAGAAPGYPGEDQVNVQLPYSLKGSGNTAVTLTVAGQKSNTVYIQIQ